MTEVPPPSGEEKRRYDLLYAHLDLNYDEETRDRLMAGVMATREQAWRSGAALRERAAAFEASIRDAMLRLDAEPTEEHRSRRLDYLMALHYLVKRCYAMADNDPVGAARWQAISDRFMDRAYGFTS